MSQAQREADVFVWGPSIEEARCTDCRACLDFCQFGVYSMTGGHVRVVAKASCMEGCSHCSTLCEPHALTFPSLDELRTAKKN